MKKWFAILAILLTLLAIPFFASADQGREITSSCQLTPGGNKKDFKRVKDRNYRSFWSSGSGDHAWIEVSSPKDVSCGAVMLKWYDHPHACSIRVPEGNGVWTEIARTEGTYLTDAIVLPAGVTRFRITNIDGKKTSFRLSELYLFGAGDFPDCCQLWESPAEKADLLLIVAHPDDEVLWFGGTLPYYAGQLRKTCQVAMMTTNMPYRRLELLDALWTCGVRNYPVWGGFSDSFGGTLTKMYQHWSRDRVYRTITGWIRRFKPEVLLTHDIRGEYGHGAHRACADGVQYALKVSADPKRYPESAREYDVWDVPKCYIHLYRENVVDMNWQMSLSAFDDKTAFEVAEEAFRCHVSQQNTDYRVEDYGPYDNSLFGLVRSLVGEDIEKNDFFEHIDGLEIEETVDTDE